MTTEKYYDDQDEIPKNEPLQKVTTDYREPSESSSSSSRVSSPRNDEDDPGLPVLFGLSHHTQHIQRHSSCYRPREGSPMGDNTIMADKLDDPPPVGETPTAESMPQSDTQADDHGQKNSVDSAIDLSMDATNLKGDHSGSETSTQELATRSRADSTQADASVASKANQPTNGNRKSPLRVETASSNAEAPQPHSERDSISASPTLSKHVLPSADVHGQSLAPFEPLSPSTSSPKAERLPSIHQITSSLTELAEAATQEIPRQQQGFSHHHSQSFGSAMAQSPILSAHLYPVSAQTSPQAYYPAVIMARSPTSTIGDNYYASSPAYAHYGPYSHRRASMVDGVPPIMPKIPTASSSGDSYSGYPSSGTEGYSTNHTTPIDISQTAEHTPRPMLPPPPDMPGMHSLQIIPPPIMIPGPYKCDVPNCTAGTFQTQYLLKYAHQMAYSVRSHQLIYHL